MLLVRPSVMLRIQINALINLSLLFYQQKKKKKKTLEGGLYFPFSSTRFKKRSKHIKSYIFIWKLHEFVDGRSYFFFFKTRENTYSMTIATTTKPNQSYTNQRSVYQKNRKSLCFTKSE